MTPVDNPKEAAFVAPACWLAPWLPPLVLPPLVLPPLVAGAGAGAGPSPPSPPEAGVGDGVEAGVGGVGGVGGPEEATPVKVKAVL